MSSHKPSRFLSLTALSILLALSTLLPNVASQKVGQFTENRPAKRFAIPNTNPGLEIALDYDQPFDVRIMSFDGKDPNEGFCITYPSTLESKIEWTGPFNTEEMHSYDNIGYYKGLYIILDSISFTLLVTQNVQDPSSYVKVASDFKNTVDGTTGQFEEPYLHVDATGGYLYIFTSEKLYTYALEPLYNAISSKTTPPKISQVSQNFKKFEDVLSIQQNGKLIYVVADNYVEVYLPNGQGDVDPQVIFDAKFFGLKELGAVDIAFKGHYAFVLDKLTGIYTVDLKYAEDTSSTKEQRFVYLTDFDIKSAKGQFVQVVADSLNLISSNVKNPTIQEYIIQGKDDLTGLVLNREIKMFQSVRDTYSDDNFLFVLTGFFNMFTKHSIPSDVSSAEDEEYLTEYWPLFGAKAMVSVPNGKQSNVVAIQDNYITQFRFYQDVPVLACSMTDIPEGLYRYEIEATQTDCYEKQQNPDTTDYNTICVINETIELLVTLNGAYLGNTTQTNKEVLALMIGLAVLNIFVLIFICLCRKYKNQYNHLQERIKFHKLDEEATESGGTAGRTAGRGQSNKQPGSIPEIDPNNINIALELEKLEEEEKKKKEEAERKEREKQKPNAEFGDLKPLDVDEIYGKGSGTKEDSF